jgi:hypothetical protein
MQIMNASKKAEILAMQAKSTQNLGFMKVNILRLSVSLKKI